MNSADVSRVSEDGANLIERNSGEPCHELLDPRSVFEVLEQRGDRNAGAAKHPRSAH